MKKIIAAAVTAAFVAPATAADVTLSGSQGLTIRQQWYAPLRSTVLLPLELL